MRPWGGCWWGPNAFSLLLPQKGDDLEEGVTSEGMAWPMALQHNLTPFICCFRPGLLGCIGAGTPTTLEPPLLEHLLVPSLSQAFWARSFLALFHPGLVRMREVSERACDNWKVTHLVNSRYSGS